MENILNNLKEKIINIYKYIAKLPLIIYNYYWKMTHSYKWATRAFNDYDWDSYYLIRMMVCKLKDMRFQFDIIDSDNVDLRHQPGNNPDEYIDYLASLDQAIEFGERILKDDYIKYTDDIQEWFNENGFFNGNIMPDYMREKLLDIHNKADNEKQSDINMFFNIIRDNHQYWWT